MKTTLLRGALSVLVVASLGACGGGGNDDAATDSTPVVTNESTTTTSAAASTSTSGAASTSSTGIDVCATIPLADVASASGMPTLDSAKKTDIGFQRGCDYRSSKSSTDKMSITVQDFGSAKEANASLDDSQKTQTRQHDVAGVGDRAWYSEEYGELHVVQGSIRFGFRGGPSNSQKREPVLVDVAKMALPKVAAAKG
jgi:hypothetical protein